MTFSQIATVIGNYLGLFTLSLLFPLALALYDEGGVLLIGEGRVAWAFLGTLLITLLLGWALKRGGSPSSEALHRREGIAASVLIWFLTPALAALPFLLSGTLSNPMQAYFEMTSGFTTTGATVLHPKQYNQEGVEVPITARVCGEKETVYQFYGTVKPQKDPSTGEVEKVGIEAVNRTLLFWRSFSQWLGGMGIIVLFVAVLPAFGAKGKVLFQSEVTGPSKEGTTPRIKETAALLWKIYLTLTMAQMGFLFFTSPGLSWYESSVITFSTISTGGFSVLNEGLAGYHDSGMEWVVILFMGLGGVSFPLYEYCFKGKLHHLLDVEWIAYLMILSLFTAGVFYSILGSPEINLTGHYVKIWEGAHALRAALFQTVSAITSTGFSMTNYNVWPYAAQVLLLIGMFIGGMSGSTAGGLKVARVLMLFKIGLHRVESIFRPYRLKRLKVGSQEVDDGLALTVLCFFLVAITFTVMAVLFYVAEGLDPETALGLAVSMLSNSGMGFRMAGPEGSCAFLSNTSLVVSSFLMIFGRLEYFAVLCLFVPAFWRNDS